MTGLPASNRAARARSAMRGSAHHLHVRVRTVIQCLTEDKNRT
jgi:hypothetical protein